MFIVLVGMVLYMNMLNLSYMNQMTLKIQFVFHKHPFFHITTQFLKYIKNFMDIDFLNKKKINFYINSQTIVSNVNFFI